jgi:hypothetical protein
MWAVRVAPVFAANWNLKRLGPFCIFITLEPVTVDKSVIQSESVVSIAVVVALVLRRFCGKNRRTIAKMISTPLTSEAANAILTNHEKREKFPIGLRLTLSGPHPHFSVPHDRPSA